MSGLFQAYFRAGGPVASGAGAFSGRGRLSVRRRRLGGRAVGGAGTSRLYGVRCLLSTSSTPHLRQFFSSVGGLSLMLSEGVRSAVTARVDPFSPWNLGLLGFPQTYTAFTGGFGILLGSLTTM